MKFSFWSHAHKTGNLEARLEDISDAAHHLYDDAGDHVVNLSAAASAINNQIGIAARVQSAAYAIKTAK